MTYDWYGAVEVRARAEVFSLGEVEHVDLNIISPTIAGPDGDVALTQLKALASVAHTSGQLVALRAEVVMHDTQPLDNEAKLPVLISFARNVAYVCASPLKRVSALAVNCVPWSVIGHSSDNLYGPCPYL